jgi:RNA polymerase sigma factor (sigma-70 family)
MSEHANDKPAGNGMIDGVTETEQLSEREHFEAVVRRYQGPLLRYVRSRLGEHDGQDVVQDVFLRLHKVMRKDGLRDIGNMGSWLFRVAHNRTGDILRRKNVADRAKAELASNGNNTTSADPGGLEEVVHREDCRLAGFRLPTSWVTESKGFGGLRTGRVRTDGEVGVSWSLELRDRSASEFGARVIGHVAQRCGETCGGRFPLF